MTLLSNTLNEAEDLGVTLCRTTTKTRAANGETLTNRVKTTIAAYKAGRFSPLVCRARTVNTYVLSKLVYRSAIVNSRCQDLNSIQSAIKNWVYKGLLIRPPETILFR